MHAALNSLCHDQRGLPELRNPVGLFENDASIVHMDRAARLPTNLDCGVREERQARTATTACLVAHDVPPLGPVHVTVTIWERGQVLIETQVMASPNDMPDLVCSE